MKYNSNEKGITLLVLVITMAVLLILATVTINAVFGDGGLIYQSDETRGRAENMITADEEKTNGIMEEYANVMAEDSQIQIGEFEPVQTPEPETGGQEFEMGYGVIEIKWLKEDTYSVSDTPNAPKVKAISNGTMELVKYVEGGATEQERWVAGTDYEYVAGIGTADNNQSKWANARVTIDGIDSYFVWIPRYAYRIVYFDSEASKNEYKNGTITEEQAIEDGKIVGYSDSRGIVTAEGKRVDNITSESNTTHIMVSEDYFMAHPAFIDGSKTGYQNGEWDDELEGLWIGKYESSLINTTNNSNANTSGSAGNILLSERTDRALAIQPGMKSWRNIQIGYMWTNAKEFATELESHMLKNSEWGAVAYLTESKYGRNGNEIGMNTNSSYITGGGANNAYATTNQNQSTTGNVYGIYDMRGGATERVAGYYNGSTSSDLTNNGGSFASNGGPSTKYATAYTGTSSSTAYKYGDATYETSGWHSDDASFVNSDYPFFHRGGYYDHLASITGVFYYSNSKGGAYTYDSFRVSLVV